jgi:hypothetical protein
MIFGMIFAMPSGMILLIVMRASAMIAIGPP